MRRLLEKGLSTLRNDGFVVFSRKTLHHLRWRSEKQYRRVRRFLKWKLGERRGYIVLKIGDIQAQFVVHDKESVYRTISRFYREYEEVAEIMEDLEKDDVFLDIGANTGLYSCFASQVCTEGRVVAFEPYSANIEELEQNAALNGGSTEVIGKALSNETGTTELSVPGKPTPGHGTAAIKTGQQGGEEVDTVLGDELIEEGEIPQPNVLKIDVEGAEFFVIEGLEKAISNEECQQLYCELHLKKSPNRPSIGDHGFQLSELEERLKGLGYDIEYKDDRYLKACRE